MRVEVQNACGGFVNECCLAELEFIFSTAALAVLCTGSWKGVGNTPGFWLLLSGAHKAPRLPLNIPPSAVASGWT